MRRLRILALRFRSLLRRSRVEQELDDELRYHLDRQIDVLVASGETPENARRLALRDLGGIDQRREECRDARGVGPVSNAHAILRDALRAIRRRPAAGLVTVFTLALGIGGGATMLAVVDALLLRPPAGIHDLDRLVVAPARNYVVFSALRDATHTLDLAAYTRPPALTLGAGAEASSVRLECVTPSYFRVLGTPIALGRAFPEEGTRSEDLGIVLAHHFWQQRYQGDDNAIGQTVQIARRTYTIVGIAPANFRGVETEPVDAWIVLEASPASCSFTGTSLLYSSGGAWLRSIARLRPGVTREQALAEVQSLWPSIDDRRRPVTSAPDEPVELPALVESMAARTTDDRRITLWILGGGLALLFISCANVAGIHALRAIDRTREFTVRAQLGASRARIVAQVMTESVVLGVLSGAAAWGLAAGLDSVLRNFFPFAPDDGLLDGRFFVGLAAATVLAGVSSGIAPAVHSARTNLKGTAGLGATRRTSRLRTTLLVAQVALALVLATAAGLFAESVTNARTGLGYDINRVVLATVDFERAGYRRQAQVQAFFDRLVERAREAPGVERVAQSVDAPFGTSGSSVVKALASSPDGPPPGFYSLNAVSPGYFATIGTHMLHGREFRDDDDASGAPVVIVDEGLARELWPNEDAVGRCAYFYPNPMCLEVVGVSERRRHRRLTRSDFEYFVSTGQPALMGDHSMPRAILIRTASSSDAAVADVATALRSAAPDMPFVNVQRLADLVDSRARTWRLGSTLFTFFGAAAVGLAAVGIFASLSFLIRQRTSEIGLRIALGATHGQVTWIVIRLALVVVGAGLTVGGIAAVSAARLIEASLFGVAPTDIGAYALAAAAIVGVGAAACVLPCIRARRIDPIVVLRTE